MEEIAQISNSANDSKALPPRQKLTASQNEIFNQRQHCRNGA